MNNRHLAILNLTIGIIQLAIFALLVAAFWGNWLTIAGLVAILITIEVN